MKIRVVRDSDGQVLATASAEERGDVQIEPDLEAGVEVEVIDLPMTDLSDVQSFYEAATRQG